MRSAGKGDQVESTSGSGPRATRRDAAAFDAAMKSLRDQHSPRFAEISGVTPTPWRYRRRDAGWLVHALRREVRRAGRSRRRRRFWLVFAVAAVLVGRLVVG